MCQEKPDFTGDEAGPLGSETDEPLGKRDRRWEQWVREGRLGWWVKTVWIVRGNPLVRVWIACYQARRMRLRRRLARELLRRQGIDPDNLPSISELKERIMELQRRRENGEKAAGRQSIGKE